jgi:hypothetical protein
MATPHPSVLSDEERARLEEAARALEESKDRPADGPVRPKPPKVLAFEEIPDATTSAPVDKNTVPTISAVAETLTTSATGAVSFPHREPARPSSLPEELPPVEPTAAPVEDAPKNSAPATSPVQNAVVTKAIETTPKATPPTGLDPVTAGDEWYPAWAADLADQRIAEKWRNAPVRGPPPSSATALGNSSTNTVTQVAVVRGQFGTEVVVATQTQRSDIDNVGVASADAHGIGGSATATGNTAHTTVLQVSVIVDRGGSGTATVEQSADVDNVGVASASTTGAAQATAVGNDSTTNVTQVAVVYIEGSGDAHVTQTTDVDNVGIASATATDRNATAVGNQSTTDVTQVSVVHVGDDDVNVGQRSTTSNIGVAAANGGTASGNTATNTTTQVAVVPR